MIGSECNIKISTLSAFVEHIYMYMYSYIEKHVLVSSMHYFNCVPLLHLPYQTVYMTYLVRSLLSKYMPWVCIPHLALSSLYHIVKAKLTPSTDLNDSILFEN